MRGDDDRLPLRLAGGDELRLHQRQPVVVDLDAEIAARDHDGICLADDVPHVAHTGLVLDFGDDLCRRAEAVEKAPQHANILRLPHERQGHEINAGPHPRLQIHFILGGQAGQVHKDARQVDVALGADGAGREHLAEDVRIVLVDHPHADQPAVDQHDSAHREIARQPGVIDGDGRRVACRLGAFDV